MGAVRDHAVNEFTPVPGLPACVTEAVQNGDPAQGPSTIQFKAPAGCLIPWHWHTPAGQVMIVNGSARIEMKHDGRTLSLTRGGQAMMPSKRVHQFTCVTACSGFVPYGAAFDIHYFNEKGEEIPPEKALEKKRKETPTT
jgi:hypothetical protein